MNELTCYCGELTCYICIKKSLLGHSNPDVIKLWNYEKNYLKIHQYLLNSNNIIILRCKICSKNFRIKIQETFKREINCENCVIENLIKKKITKNKMSDKQYNCQKCDVSFQFKYQLERHNNSKKHIGNKVAYHCGRGSCDYHTINKTNFKMHMLNNHSTVKQKMEGFPYYCKTCDIGCGSVSTYDKHMQSKKHANNIDTDSEDD
jgi:hypothetical protein